MFPLEIEFSPEVATYCIISLMLLIQTNVSLRRKREDSDDKTTDVEDSGL